nr:hypothetical protein [uncultured Carboxylicivirga sp.]
MKNIDYKNLDKSELEKRKLISEIKDYHKPFFIRNFASITVVILTLASLFVGFYTGLFDAKKEILELDVRKFEERKVLLSYTIDSLKESVQQISSQRDSVEDLATDYVIYIDSLELQISLLKLALAEQQDSNEYLRVYKVSYEKLKEELNNTSSQSQIIQGLIAESQENIQVESDRVSQSVIQRNDMVVEKRIRAVGKRGWIYVGHFKNNTFANTRKLSTDKIPQKGSEYVLIEDSYLRESRPKAPFYKIPDQIMLLLNGTKVKVLDVEPDVGFDKVWIEVEVLD